MDPYRTTRSPLAAEPPIARHSDVGLLWMIMAVGLMPYAGLAVHGHASESELGPATVLVLFAVRELGREAWRRMRARHSRRRRPQKMHANG